MKSMRADDGGPNNEEYPHEGVALSRKRESAGWALETMKIINEMTPDIKGKAFDPDWFLLRERLEEAEKLMKPNEKETCEEN